MRDDPFEQLERSHRRLEERLDDLARATSGGGGRAVDIELVREVAAFFARAVRRHEEDEERSVFPRLAGHAELEPVIARLARDHREHEELHGALGRLLAADAPPTCAEVDRVADALTRAYRAHIDEEERVLFPAARVALDDVARAAIRDEMQARRGR